MWISGGCGRCIVNFTHAPEAGQRLISCLTIRPPVPSILAMSLTSLCLRFDQTGSPADVLKLAERSLPPLGSHDVRVRMRYAPVNPADLNFIEGNYGRAAHPPAIPGHEGCGEVQAVGPEVTSLKPGDVVMPLLGAGCWAQHLTAAEHFFARLPESIDPVQAAMLRINPVTAWHLLTQHVALSEGEWVLQNAANSGVGRALIQIARQRGLKTANFVRRKELADELRQLGADAVFTDDEKGLEEARERLKAHPPRLAANAVGGDSALRQMDLLAPEGMLVTYGAMSRRSLKVPNKFLIFKGLRLHGLWITRWYEQASSQELHDALEPLARMILDHELHTAVEEVIPMAQYARAMQRAAADSRAGKIVLDLA
jgi:NADPH:quinone reductase-like Zn-dependent oxidoreductase